MHYAIFVFVVRIIVWLRQKIPAKKRMLRHTTSSPILLYSLLKVNKTQLYILPRPKNMLQAAWILFTNPYRLGKTIPHPNGWGIVPCWVNTIDAIGFFNILLCIFVHILTDASIYAWILPRPKKHATGSLDSIFESLTRSK